MILNMTRISLALLLVTGTVAAAQPADLTAGVESVKTGSGVSVLADPLLSDGRLVLKVAAMNRTGQPLSFGPGNVVLSTADGEPIEWIPLQSLINDVKLAAGIPVDETASTELPSSYSAPAMSTNQAGQLDVSGYTGSMGVAGAEFTSRRAAEKNARKKVKPEVQARVDEQIAGLRAGILQTSNVTPGEIGSGQLVSEKLNLGRGDGRLLRVKISFAGEEHSFDFVAPPEK